jgi:hypothetical protein
MGAMSPRCAVIVLLSILTACSTPPDAAKSPAPAPKRVAASSNPVARYIELTGLRLGEKGPGKLSVRFGAVNHSDADLGDLVMEVQLSATSAKAGEPPFATFTAKIGQLGPQEWKDIEVIVPTKLRVYELPDWQFVKADFQVTEPK